MHIYQIILANISNLDLICTIVLILQQSCKSNFTIMEVLIITILIIVIMALVLAVIVAHAIIQEKNELLDVNEKIIAALIEKQDYQS